jgi:hypothetical protein
LPIPKEEDKVKAISMKLALIVLIVSQIAASCNVGVDEKTRHVLQDVILALDKQPDLWKDTLNGAIDELGIVGTRLAKTVAGEIRGVIQTTEAAAFCAADFMGIRASQKIQEILYKYFPDSPPPVYVPVICTINPPVIDSSETQYVEYQGFDFYSFRETGTFSADLVYGEGNNEVIKPNFGKVRVETNYLIVVDIQTLGNVEIDASLNPQLILRWEDKVAKGKSEVMILVATPTPILYDYKIVIATGCNDDCGKDCSYSAPKDATVRITLIGSNGQRSSEIQIPGYFKNCGLNSATLFGQPDLGLVQRVYVKYDDHGQHNGWMLGWIHVINKTINPNENTDNIMWLTPCYMWFGHDATIEDFYPPPSCSP